MKLDWTLAAKADIKAAKDHIEKENPTAARQQVKKIVVFAAGLLLMPRKGTRYKIKDTYKIPVPKTKFSIIWKVYKEQGKISVLRVMHQSRQLPEVSEDDDGNIFDVL